MTRPTLEVADIVRKHGDEFFNRYRRQLSYQQVKALNAIERCRTAALGGHVDECSRCGHAAISYNSCRNRHCPKCQAQARQRWLAAREQELLDTPYFHVVFTLPHALAPLALPNSARFSTAVVPDQRANAARDHGATRAIWAPTSAFLSVLHTWGQNLTQNPHS